MRESAKRWRQLGKILLALLILIFVGIRFERDLRELDLSDVTLRPVWLFVSGFLYLTGLGSFAVYWRLLLLRFEQKPRWFSLLRAYYLSHLGKYIPGKAMALILRGAVIGGPDVKFGVAIISAFYEVLTAMASGALVAALLFTLWPPHIPGLDFNPVFLGLLLLGLIGVPLLPGVFNRLVQGLARRFQNVESFRLPQLESRTLIYGLAITSAGWAAMGLSLWALLQAVVPEPTWLTVAGAARLTAMVSLAYVAGFLAVVVPSGVGVREYLMLPFLPGEIGDPSLAATTAVAAMSILLLRIVWTVSELLAAAVLYFWPGTMSPRAAAVKLEANGVEQPCQ